MDEKVKRLVYFFNLSIVGAMLDENNLLRHERLNYVMLKNVFKPQYVFRLAGTYSKYYISKICIIFEHDIS